MSDEIQFSSTETCIQHLKLEVPRQRIPLVHRAKLLSQLNAAAPHRLCLLVAPAGFGKTTVLSQWIDHLAASGRKVAWLSLDEGDSDPRQFLAYVVFALNRAGIELGRLPIHAEQGLAEITPELCVTLISQALQSCEQQVTLILDDYHRASNHAINTVVYRLTKSVPDSFSLTLSSRTRPAFGVPQLLASGWAAEINAEQLRLSAGEARALIGGGLGEAELEMLLERTEGWPVALQLARMMLKNDQVPTDAIKQLTSRGGHLSTYLADQVMQGMPVRVVEFLLQTSILERFNVPLADALRGHTDSWEITEALEPLQSLLTYDAESGWFRYHHLFAEYLQSQLVQSHPQEVSRLHLCASEWFERNGLVTEAVKHAREAGNFKRCASLIEAAGGWRLILYGGIGYLRNLLRYMPEAERASYPRTLLAAAYLQMKDGQIQAAKNNLSLVADSLPETAPDPTPSALERDWINLTALLRAYEDDYLDEANTASFGRLRDRVPASDYLTRGTLDCAEACEALCIGQLEHAEDMARAAMKLMRSASSVLGVNYCYLHAGVASAYRGDLACSSAYFAESRRMAEENFGADSGLKSISDVLCGALHFWRTGSPDTSPEVYRRSAEHVRSYDGWFEVFAAGLDVRFRLALARGDIAELQDIVTEGQSLVIDRGMRRLSLIVQSQRLLIALQRDAMTEASTLGDHLQHEMPIGCWRRQRGLWRPYQDVGLALSCWQETSDRELALRTATDVIECGRTIGARLPLIRALTRRAMLLDHAGDRVAALNDLGQAVTFAAAQQVAEPFKDPNLAPLLRDMSKRLRGEAGNPIELKFLADIVGDIDGAAALGQTEVRNHLSPREMDVAQELCLGLTNKEIARALDMTEHTVKFHLRNIFAKLGVDRRAHALALLKTRHSPVRRALDPASSRALPNSAPRRGEHR